MDKMQENPVIRDNGGSRSGRDRRQKRAPIQCEEKRSGRERRGGVDRRSGLARRRKPKRRTGKYWNGSCVERRDAFRARFENLRESTDDGQMKTRP